MHGGKRLFRSIRIVNGHGTTNYGHGCVFRRAKKGKLPRKAPATALKATKMERRWAQNRELLRHERSNAREWHSHGGNLIQLCAAYFFPRSLISVFPFTVPPPTATAPVYIRASGWLSLRDGKHYYLQSEIRVVEGGVLLAVKEAGNVTCTFQSDSWLSKRGWNCFFAANHSHIQTDNHV